MKNKEKYDLNTLKVKWISHPAEIIVKHKYDESIIFSKKIAPTETGMSAYNAWLEQEYKPLILDDVENAYLSAVIKPFRKRIKYIEKIDHSNVKNDQYLCIALANDRCVLPNFKKGTMYKGMEADKEYTLEELGL